MREICKTTTENCELYLGSLDLCLWFTSKAGEDQRSSYAPRAPYPGSAKKSFEEIETPDVKKLKLAWEN